MPYADLANPQTLNLYTYVQNNPLTYTDPTGHMMTSSTREDMWTQIMVKMGGNPEGCIGDGSCSGGTQWEVTILDTQAMIDFTSAKGRLKELRSIAPMLESCRAQT